MCLLPSFPPVEDSFCIFLYFRNKLAIPSNKVHAYGTIHLESGSK